MKINTKLKNITINDFGNLDLTFEVTELNNKIACEELKKVDYVIDIKERKSIRSINQNNFFWKIISEISFKIGIDDISLYIQLLEMCNCKYLICQINVSDEKSLKRQFRATKLLEYLDLERTKAVYKVYYGSSTFNTKEMNELIDCALDYASHNDIHINDERYANL